MDPGLPLSPDEGSPAAVDAPDAIRITFGEPVDGSTVPGAIRLHAARPGGLWVEDPPVDVIWSAGSPAEVIVRPRTGLPFPRGHEYRLVVGAGIRSAAGRSLAADLTGYFATDPALTLGQRGVSGEMGNARTVEVAVGGDPPTADDLSDLVGESGVGQCVGNLVERPHDV